MQIDPSFKPYGYIYTVTNKINGKQYVGQTIEIPQKRWWKYKKLNCIQQPKLYNALKKYGAVNFLYEILDTAPDQIVLDYLEDFYIECLDTVTNGYNCKSGGGNGRHSEMTKQKMSASHKGIKHSEESKAKMSLSQTGRVVTPEMRLKMSASRKSAIENGWKLSDDARLKITEKITGHLVSESTKHKISESQMGTKNHMYGKNASEETRKKMSDAHKGRKFSEETRERMRLAWIKRKQ